MTFVTSKPLLIKDYFIQICSARDVGWAVRKARKNGLRNQIEVGSTVPPESPSMNPETGMPSTTHTSKIMKVAESQNGGMVLMPSKDFYCCFTSRSCGQGWR